MSRCFTSGTPNLSASNYTYNKKCKVMYENIVDTNLNGDCVTWDGKTGMDCSGYLLHTDSAETHLALKYGAALCNPCDISGLVTDPGDPSGIFDKCLCRVPFPPPMFNVIINLIADAFSSAAKIPPLDTIKENMARVGLGPDYLLLPWHILQSPDSWNANNIQFSVAIGGFALETAPTVNICIPACSDNSGCICCTDNCNNVLCCSECNFTNQTDLSGFQYFDTPALPCVVDSSGASQLPGIYGAYLCAANNANIFNEPCDAQYYPEGTFAFTLQEAIGAWLYLWEPIVNNNPTGTGHFFVAAFKQAGFEAIRPRTTVSNYLSRFKKKIRFFRPLT